MIPSEEILESIFKLGIKTSGSVSTHFLETVRSFYQNGYDSPQLKTLVKFLENKDVFGKSGQNRGDSSRSRRSDIFDIHEGDDESEETL